jgi:uncharacterized protein (DUF1778 family)
VAFHVQAIDADINHKAHHPQPAGQRIRAKNKLREAAQAVGVDLSAFILSAAMERAESVLDNQRRRELSNQSWELMNQLIAEPAQPTLALKALMKRKNSDGRQA